MVTSAALQLCSSSTGGGLTFSTSRIDDGTGYSFVGCASTPLDLALDVSNELEFIRNASGLTRDQLAAVLGVSRRTVQNWVNGAPVRRQHYDRVIEVCDHVQSMRSQPAFKIRQRLFRHYGLDETRTIQASSQPPVLASDEQPFVHHLGTRKTKMKILRR
ncbi:helix-turn-helix domain-containing protein [Novosphingobium fluoreni]